MSKLDIKLEVVGVLQRSDEVAPVYDVELDNITSVFSDICETLSLQPNVQFIVSGFGQELWPVDVKTDLLCAVEELGEIVQKISLENYNFELDFYEQGVERKLIFESRDLEVIIKCESYTNWIPLPSSITMSKNEVKEIFYSLKFTFCSAADQACPNLINHEWFKAWSESRQNQ